MREGAFSSRLQPPPPLAQAVPLLAEHTPLSFSSPACPYLRLEVGKPEKKSGPLFFYLNKEYGGRKRGQGRQNEKEREEKGRKGRQQTKAVLRKQEGEKGAPPRFPFLLVPSAPLYLRSTALGVHPLLAFTEP